MTELHLCVSEPFLSPAWGSNFVLFTGDSPVPEDASREYLRKVCKYAKTHGVYLVPQRFMLMGYQCMGLISPDGKVLGAQKALHINTLDRIGKRSGVIDIVSTPFGGVFLCVDVDIYHPEIPRIAASMGAHFIFCSQRIHHGDYSSNMVLTGPWNAAQAAGVYVVATSGDYNCICAPLPLTKHEDGFVAQPGLKTPLTAALQGEKLQTLTPPYRLSRRFYAVHRGDLTR